MLKGIDVSRYNGWPVNPDGPSPAPDFVPVAAAGYKFVAIRATIGDYYTDPMFERNWDAAQAAGLKTAAYHVVRADKPVEAQMARLRSVVDGNEPKLVVLDAEVTPANLTQFEIERAHYWMGRRAREHFAPRGCDVWFYSGKWWWDPNIGPQQWVAQDPFGWWLAAYGANDGTVPATEPRLPVSWPRRDAWQYTSRGSVPGIQGFVDLDQMTEAAYEAAWGEPAPAPPPEPSPKVPVEIRAPAGTIDLTFTEL